MLRIILKTILFLVFSTNLNGQNIEKEVVDIDNEIQGDLYLGNPKSDELIIIVAGSGPTDRNGNQPPNLYTNTYKYLAEDLAKNQQNVFTFDKRIIAQIKKQTIREENIRFEDNVSDLNLIIDTFENRFSKIILVGHSEGSLIALLSTNHKAVIKYISIAGQGETIDNILNKQIKQNAPFLSKQSDEILEELKKGNTIEVIPPMLQTIYRPSVQPYLISWIKIDPANEIKKINKPILILQGDKDLQVDLEQGNLLHHANPNSKLITIQGMNHILKRIDKEEENIKSYNNISLPLHKGLVKRILYFIQN